RRADEVRGPAPEDRVVAVVAVDHHRSAAVLRQKAEARAVVPAARPLKDIAAHRADTADLRRAHALHRGPQRGIALAQPGVTEQLLEGGQGAQAQAAGPVIADARQLLDAAQVDHALGRDD